MKTLPLTPPRRARLARAAGAAVFLFFLLKGLIWLALAGAALYFGDALI